MTDRLSRISCGNASCGRLLSIDGVGISGSTRVDSITPDTPKERIHRDFSKAPLGTIRCSCGHYTESVALLWRGGKWSAERARSR